MGKAVDFLGLHVIVEQGEVSLRQVADEMAVLVGDGENKIHLIDDGRDGVGAILLRFGSWLLGWVRRRFPGRGRGGGCHLFCRLGCGRRAVLRLRNILRAHQNGEKRRSYSQPRPMPSEFQLFVLPANHSFQFTSVKGLFLLDRRPEPS